MAFSPPMDYLRHVLLPVLRRQLDVRDLAHLYNLPHTAPGVFKTTGACCTAEAADWPLKRALAADWPMKRDSRLLIGRSGVRWLLIGRLNCGAESALPQISAEVEVERRGFYPKGGGMRLSVEAAPAGRPLPPLQLTERGAVRK